MTSIKLGINLARCSVFSYKTVGHRKTFLRIKKESSLRTSSSMNTVLLPFSQLFSFSNFFNDPKFALVIHSTEKSILRCFTGVTLCSQSHFSQIISDHILITYAYSLPACLGQMIILTLSNASLSLCSRIYYPANVHGHCRGIRSYSLSVIF